MDWNSIYRSRVTTADDAVKEIRSGDRVWVHPGCNTPTRLIDAMVARAPELEDVEVVHILTDVKPLGCHSLNTLGIFR